MSEYKLKIGTTPTHNFVIPFDVSLISNLRISYAQNDNEVFYKTKKDCSLSENTISVTLSQEETFLFEYGQQIQVQLRIIVLDGNVTSSDPITLFPEKSFNKEVLTNGL